MKRTERNKKKYKKQSLKRRILKCVLKFIIYEIIGATYAIYSLIHWIDTNIGKLFMKLKRPIKAIIIYLLIGLAVYGNLNTKTITKTIVKHDKINIMFKELPKEQEQQETIKTCNMSQIECDIYNTSIENGLDENQAKILISISKHETGNWTSKAFKNKNNFGGVMCSTGLRNYPSYDEGLAHFVQLLKNRYFDKGLTTIEQIGHVYCPVGASNDPTGVNQYWIPNVTKYFNEYLTK